MPFLHLEKLGIFLLHRLLILFLIGGEIAAGFFCSFFMLLSNLLAGMRFGITVFIRNLMAFAGNKSK